MFDYFKHIVPILNQHCLECHNSDRPEGNVNLNSDLRPASFVDSYRVLSSKQTLGDNRNRPMSNFKPYEIGSSASTLFLLLEKGHPDAEGKARVTLSPEELRLVRYWLNCGANYAGTYAANACGLLNWSYSPYTLDGQTSYENAYHDENWPEREGWMDVVKNVCAECHDGSETPGKRGALPYALSYNTKAYSSTWGVNLSYPEKSRFINYPLSQSAGGKGRCKRKDETGKMVPAEVFKDTNDPNYQKMLAYIKRGQKFITEERTHFSLTPFHPNPWYTREMVRFGVLPPDYVEGTPIDPYETDMKFWELLGNVEAK